LLFVSTKNDFCEDENRQKNADMNFTFYQKRQFSGLLNKITHFREVTLEFVFSGLGFFFDELR
jgi:hypothetical protein